MTTLVITADAEANVHSITEMSSSRVLSAKVGNQPKQKGLGDLRKYILASKLLAFQCKVHRGGLEVRSCWRLFQVNSGGLLNAPDNV